MTAVNGTAMTTPERVGQVLRRLGLFAFVLWLQVGHMIEHLSLALRGVPLLGAEADSQLFHFLFNSAIAVVACVLLFRHPRNPWVYVLAIVALLHESEDLYVYAHYVLASGALNGPITEGETGLLGIGGAIGVIPITQLDLHNIYNGSEWILVTLGFWYELESLELGAPEDEASSAALVA
jgi:hypothetical protein